MLGPDLVRAFKYVPDLYIILSPQGEIITVSDAFLTAIQTTAETLVSKPLSDFFPTNFNKIQHSLQQAVTSKKAHQLSITQYPLLQQNNLTNTKHWQVVHTAVFNEEAEVDYLIHKVREESLAELQAVLASERTARQKAEDRERQLRLMTNSLPILISYLDKNEHYQFVNTAYEGWFNKKADEIIGRSVREVIGDKAYATVKQYIDRVLAGEKFDFEAEMLYRDGFTKHIHTNYIPDDRNGEIVGFFAVVTDITERVVAHQKLEKREQYFREMADEVPVIIWLTDANGHCTFLNKQWGKYTGQAVEKSLGFGWLKAVHPDDAKVASEIFTQANEEQTSFNLTYRLRGKDGNYRWAIDVGQPMFNKEGSYDGFIGVVFDIHERKMAENALQSVSEQLAEANQKYKVANQKIISSNAELAASNRQLSFINADLDNFIYTASHDLRAPISNIEGLMQAMQRNLREEVQKNPLIEKLMGLIDDSILRFKKTLDDLTQITKIQREYSEEQLAYVDLPDLLEQVKLDLAAEIEKAGAHFDQSLENCSPIRFSAKNARSILYNLVSNALKYRSAERSLCIHIACYQQDNYQVLSVQDNGMGMKLTNESKIFAMFKRLHDHVEGTGIGLYIVKKIIENAGGKIEVESKLNEGTTFRVCFLK